MQTSPRVWGVPKKGSLGGAFEGGWVEPQCALCIDCKLQKNITLPQMAQFLVHSFFHSGI